MRIHAHTNTNPAALLRSPPRKQRYSSMKIGTNSHRGQELGKGGPCVQGNWLQTKYTKCQVIKVAVPSWPSPFQELCHSPQPACAQHWQGSLGAGESHTAQRASFLARSLTRVIGAGPRRPMLLDPAPPRARPPAAAAAGGPPPHLCPRPPHGSRSAGRQTWDRAPGRGGCAIGA